MSQAQARVPAQAWMFGLISLAPFYIAAGVYCYGPDRLSALSLAGLAVWSTTMLSFLGGIRAGRELDREQFRWWSLALALLTPIAGFSLLFGPLIHRFDAVWQVSGFLTAFLLVWLWDVRDVEGPSWRPRYRTLVTAGAAIALAFALEQALSM